MPSARPAAIASVAALDDPQRSRLYEMVRRARHPVTREEAARAVHISRKLAAFHLDKLVSCGLLEVVSLPAAARRGVGRTPKHYQPTDGVVSVSLPDRSFETLAAILVDATSEVPGEKADEARTRIAAEHGRVLGETLRRVDHDLHGRVSTGFDAVEAVLLGQGFEPYRTPTDTLRLYNCPFQPLAERAPDLVCGINLHYLAGLLVGLKADRVLAVLAPRAGECCVEVCSVT